MRPNHFPLVSKIIFGALCPLQPPRIPTGYLESEKDHVHSALYDDHNKWKQKEINSLNFQENVLQYSCSDKSYGRTEIYTLGIFHYFKDNYVLKLMFYHIFLH